MFISADNDESSEKKASGFPTFSTHNDISNEKWELSEDAVLFGVLFVEIPRRSFCGNSSVGAQNDDFWHADNDGDNIILIIVSVIFGTLTMMVKSTTR